MAAELSVARSRSKYVLRATSPADAPELIPFLARFLHREALAPAMVDWKLWAHREDYSGHRSFVLEKSGCIVAHAGVWPIVVQTPAGPLCGCHLFDWAADARVLGAGVAIVQRIAESFDFVYGIGGSEMTQKIIPSIGFKKVGEAWSAARPLRPLMQALSHQRLNWKIPVRLMRNMIWSAVPATACPAGWTSQEGITQGENQLPVVQAGTYIIRSEGYFRYLTRCPGAQMRVFDLFKDERRVGRMGISFLHHQARLAGIWLNRPSRDDLHATYSLAQKISLRAPDVFEIVAIGSSAVSKTAATSAGFRIRKCTPIYMMSAKSQDLSPLLEFQMAENDAFFQSIGGPAYWT